MADKLLSTLYTFFIGNLSIADVGILAMVCVIKFNDLAHLERHNRITDSRRVANGEMSLEAYYFAHKNTEPLSFSK
jgi:hypothetical protein